MIRAAFITALAMLFIAAPASAETVGVAPGSELASAPQALSQCLAGSSSLDVLFLIDESGSLQSTDPNALRVDGLKSALAGLARLAAVPVNGHTTSVQVLFEGFAGSVDPDPFSSPASAWTNLDESTLKDAEQEAATFRSRAYATDTDYALALRDARILLQHKVVGQTLSGGAVPCKALIWTTDGGYQITPRVGAVAKRLPKTEPYAPHITITTAATAREAEHAGRQYMCRREGLLDGLASDGVVRFTVGLSKLMTAEQQSFLETTTVGGNGSTSCGSRLSHATGEYLSVSKADCLFFVLGGLLEGSGCPPSTRFVCTPSVCERGANAFQAPAGVSAFVIRASTGGKHITVHLRGPDGSEQELVPLHDESSTLSGAFVAARWPSERTAEIEGSLPEAHPSWVGPWTYTFVDPTGKEPSAVPISAVSLRTPLQAHLVGTDRLVRGTTAPVEIELANPQAQSAAPDPLLARASVTATVTNPLTQAVEHAPVEPGRSAGLYTVRVPVSLTTTATALYVNIEASFPNVSGTPILPVRASFSLPVVLPANQGFPTVDPLALRLSSITGSGTATARLSFTGTSTAPGCFWAGSPITKPPSETHKSSASVAPATSEASCVHVAAGEGKTLTVTLHVSEAGYGALHLVVPVYLHSSLTGRTAQVDVTGTSELLPARNVAKRVAIFVLLLAIGTLLPLFLLWLLNWFGALFPPADEIRVLRREVEVWPDGTLKPASTDTPSTDTPMTTYYDSDFRPMEGSQRRSREIPLDLATGSNVDRALPPIVLRGAAAAGVADLFRGPLGKASIRENRLVTPKSGPLRSWDDGGTVEVPLALWGTWLFCPTRQPASGTGGGAASAVRGRLVLFIRDGGDVAAGARLLETATDELSSYDWQQFTGIDAAGGDEEKPTLRERFGLLWRVRRGAEYAENPPAQDFPDPPADPAPRSDRNDGSGSRPDHKEGSRL